MNWRATVGRSDRLDSLNQAKDQISLILIWCATGLAREGAYSEAERLLNQRRSESGVASASALHLLARICAQQGRFHEAEKHWKEILRQNPGDEDAKAALKRIGRLAGKPAWLGAALKLGVFSIILTCVAAGLFYVRPRPIPQPTRKPSISVTQMEVANMPAKPTIPAAPLAASDIRVHGVLFAKTSEGITAEFESPLFDQGVQFHSGARRQISVLAQQLRPHSEHLTLLVSGYTDDLPLRRGSRFRDNTSLAFARAESTLRELTKAGLDPDIIRLNGPKAAPWPNDSIENRQRNRTVSILISNREK